MTPRWAEELWTVGDKVYGRCANCGEIVRVNKRIFGSMHLCGDPNDRARR